MHSSRRHLCKITRSLSDYVLIGYLYSASIFSSIAVYHRYYWVTVTAIMKNILLLSELPAHLVVILTIIKLQLVLFHQI